MRQGVPTYVDVVAQHVHYVLQGGFGTASVARGF